MSKKSYNNKQNPGQVLSSIQFRFSQITRHKAEYFRLERTDLNIFVNIVKLG